jgi:hypothetical protein
MVIAACAGEWEAYHLVDSAVSALLVLSVGERDRLHCAQVVAHSILLMGRPI